MTRPNNPPAFPQLKILTDDEHDLRSDPDPGMTYHQWLVGQVLNGLASASNDDGEWTFNPEMAVEIALETADRVTRAYDDPSS